MGRVKRVLQWAWSVVLAVWAYSYNWLGRQRTMAARGQGLVEYALILVLIAIVTIGALTALGKKTSSVFADVNCALDMSQDPTNHGNSAQHLNNGQGWRGQGCQ